MDPIPRTTLTNTIAPSTRIGETAAVTPATATVVATPQGAVGLVASAQVDISPLGQFLSGVALSRRQMLALQGLAEQPNGSVQQAGVNADLLAVAQQLTQSFAQLQTSGIDASQLAASGNSQNNFENNLAQRYDLLSGDGTTDTAGALAQNGNLLTQAGLSRIGIDLRGEQVDAAALQAAFEADRAGTLDALQQGTDVMAQVGAVLAQQQGQAAASVVAADLSTQSPVQQADATTAAIAPDVQGYAQAEVQAEQQAAALARRQREVQQQMENEELVQDMQSLQTQQATQLNQLSAINQEQQTRQLQDSDAATQRAQALQDDQQRVQTERSASDEFDARRVAQDQQLQQQAASEFEQQRQAQLQTDQTGQAQLQQRARQAADEAAQAQLDASEAQIAARAASERAQQLAREAQLQLDAGQAATAQAQLAQQNSEAQLQAARNAAQVNPPPSSQDPSVAAAIAAYNLTNMAASSGLAGRAAAGDTQKPLVAPVAAVEPAKPVNQIQPNIDSRT
ncbi:hypothetical protein [Janthinobacterium aquaticum]|uniref:hypothetical protein n=1 Tax=Janthinobacterium sp. FT58W TaxID=2654254 RepID=UPI0012650F91|nr:hypothetical protein [Janthinobacterium sp. FT58W]KAB8037433.1 hypothetical protein GCM43_23820 [Janthinobacterium sp. FT58W]